MHNMVSTLLETERLSLRRLCPQMMTDSVYTVVQRNIATLEYYGIYLVKSPASSFNAEACRQWLHEAPSYWDKGKVYEWGIFDKAQGVFLGSAGVFDIHPHTTNDGNRYKGELFYWIDAMRRRQGFAFESKNAILQELRRCNFARLQLTCTADNANSQRLAEKLGFSRERGWTDDAVEYFIQLSPSSTAARTMQG